MLQLFYMIKSEDGIKRRCDFFWFVVDFSFEKYPIGHIFTWQYYGLQEQHEHHLKPGVNLGAPEGLVVSLPVI